MVNLSQREFLVSRFCGNLCYVFLDAELNEQP